MLDKFSCHCHAHDTETYSEDDRVTKLQVRRLVNRCQHIGSFGDCHHTNIGNFEKDT